MHGRGKRIAAVLLGLVALLGLSGGVAAPAQADASLVRVANTGPYQDDIRAELRFTFDAGCSGCWKHIYSDVLCDEPGLTVGAAMQVSGGGPYYYYGSFSCNGAEHRSGSSVNNVIYSSARYIRYEFNSPSRGTYCIWIAPRAAQQTSEGAC